MKQLLLAQERLRQMAQEIFTTNEGNLLSKTVVEASDYVKVN
jgi:hypothetical protein